MRLLWVKELNGKPDVTVRLVVELVDGDGREHLKEITVRNRSPVALERISTAGLFVMTDSRGRSSRYATTSSKTSMCGTD